MLKRVGARGSDLGFMPRIMPRIERIQEFYNDDWYNKCYNDIYNATYKDLKELLIRFKEFKIILEIKDTNNKDDLSFQIETDQYQCLKRRIEYKYNCISRQDRNIQHDVKILKQIYHYDKYIDLKTLFKRLIRKRAELKKEELERQREEFERQREERERQEEFFQDDLEMDDIINGSGDGSSESFTPAVKPKPVQQKVHTNQNQYK
jgi:hypothetical protein